MAQTTLEWDTWCNAALEFRKRRVLEAEQVDLGNGFKLMKCLTDSEKEQTVLAIERRGRRFRGTRSFTNAGDNCTEVAQSLFRAALILGKENVCGKFSCLSSGEFDRPNLKLSRLPSIVEDTGQKRVGCNMHCDESKICFNDAVRIPESTLEQISMLRNSEVTEEDWSDVAKIKHIKIGNVRKRKLLRRLIHIVNSMKDHEQDEQIYVGFKPNQTVDSMTDNTQAEQTNFRFTPIEVEDRWSHISYFKVSTAVFVDAKPSTYGECKAWTLESQQLIDVSSEKERQVDEKVTDLEMWDMTAEFKGSKVIKMSVKGEVRISWIEKVRKLTHTKIRSKTISDTAALKDSLCSLSLPLKEEDLEMCVENLRDDQVLLVAVFMDMLVSRKDIKFDIKPNIDSRIFSSWQIHHNRGVMLFGGLKWKYRILRRYLGTTATEKGVLVPVSIAKKIFSWFVVLFMIATSIFLGWTLYSPETCNEPRCGFWMKIDVVIFLCGIVITFFTLNELFLEEERNLRSIFSGLFRVRTLRAAAFWTGEKTEDIISLLWVPYLENNDDRDGTKEYFIEPTRDFLHGDIKNAHYLRLIRKSYQSLNVTRPPFWNFVKFEMKFPPLKYKRLEHLFYFTADKESVVGLEWAKSIKIKKEQRRILILPIYSNENLKFLDASRDFPDENVRSYKFD